MYEGVSIYQSRIGAFFKLQIGIYLEFLLIVINSDHKKFQFFYNVSLLFHCHISKDIEIFLQMHFIGDIVQKDESYIIIESE